MCELLIQGFGCLRCFIFLFVYGEKNKHFTEGNWQDLLNVLRLWENIFC